MIYPENAAEKLGFTEIRELIKGFCLNSMGQQMVDKMRPAAGFEIIDRFLRQSREFKTILQNDAPLPLRSIYDIKAYAERARIEGAFLLEEEFFQVSSSLATVFAIIHYFEERSGQYPQLQSLLENVPVEKSIITKIETVIDNKGKIRSNASKELLDIITGISKAEHEARKRTDQIFKNAQNNNWTSDGGLTFREGRMCIPILKEHKRRIKGFIHDESSSGQTVYLEPEDVFQLNNTIRDLEFEKRREITRILIALTDQLRPFVPLLLSYNSLLAKIDFIRAKALFAIEIEGEMPQLIHEAELDLINARHPMLLLSLKKEKQTVVPMNLRIDEQQRLIVVSGPNAGGKSVCMKTVGLLQMMVQSGLLIPASEYSKVGIFKQIFADIGDDQSIESDLSTYSAHLSKMKYFVEKANGKTLVVIDEFGTGTDPQFGGPIAEGVLVALNHKKARGVVTTHYSNLKAFAGNTEGLANACMLFDNVNMQPLYILETGKPGSSYAFEIAQKIGLPGHVLKYAKSRIGEQQKKVEYLLVDLEREKKELSDRRTRIEKQEAQAKALLEENEKLKIFYNENKKKLLKDAKEEAQNIIRNANKLVENTILEIKQSSADKQKTKELRQHLQEELKKVEIDKEPKKKTETVKLIPGDWVKIIDTETFGQVIEIAKENVILAIGDLRSVVKLNRVEKTATRSVPKQLRKTYSLTESMEAFSFDLDIRGMRGEEAMGSLEKFVDRAIMTGVPAVRIIHGKGDGILRKLVRERLKQYKQVTRMEDEPEDRGGSGVTLVYFE